MTIEFQTQHAAVSEKLIGHIRNELMNMYHRFNKISRAEIIIKEDTTIIPAENKMCEIKLTIYGDDLLVHSRSGSFDKSVRAVLKELMKLVQKRVAEKNELPDIVTSTVKIK